jgi:hypothetical protein
MFLLGFVTGVAATLVGVILWGLTLKREDILKTWSDF